MERPTDQLKFSTPDVLEALRKRGVLDERALQAIRRSGATYDQIDELLLGQHSVSPKVLAQTYASALKLPYIELGNKTIPAEVLERIDKAVAQRYRMVGYDASGTHLYIAIANPARLNRELPQVLQNIKQQHGLDLHIAVTTDDDIKQALKWYPSDSSKEPKTEEKLTRRKVGPIDLLHVRISYQTLAKFPAEIAAKYQMVVFAHPDPHTIRVAARNPQDQKVGELLDFVQKKHHLQVELYQATKEGIQHALEGYTNQKGVAPILQPSAKPATPPDEGEKAPPHPAREPAEKTSNLITISSVPTVPAGETGAGEKEVQDLETHNLNLFLKEKLNSPQDLAAIIRQGYIPQTVAAIIALAIKQLASDVHIEPLREHLRLRYRIDGILREVLLMPAALQAPIISRIKILAKLKIDEQRIPQDGRFDVKYQGKAVDLRVSTLPTIYGEKAVMRILDKSTGVISLEELGMSGAGFERVKENIKKPYGIILATGPTGSGKSTTLYAILQRISTPEVNVITLEDPVEYEIAGVNQSQVKPKIGFSFAEGIRSVVRQDPNIIMVGEIRDGETAQMATHAALTGHLVLTTLHTNDASGALPRLINMGVEPFLITTSINAIIAQRLVRKVCPDCREKITVPEPVVAGLLKELEALKHPQPVFYRGKGCPNCTEGYRGRVGIFEVLVMSEAIEELAVSSAPASKIAERAIAEGMITMKQDGILKVFAGLTTLDEVLRVTQSN